MEEKERLEEALKKEAETLLKVFENSPLANGYKAGLLGVVVLHTERMQESLVVMKLKAEERPEDGTKLYAAFMLAHKDGTPPELLFPLGYKMMSSIKELEMFVANLEFDFLVLDTKITHSLAEA